MPDQIPEGCMSLKQKLDKLTNELAIMRDALSGVDPADRPAYLKRTGQKEREVVQAKSAFEACLKNPPPPPPPPPVDHIPGVPDECVACKRKLDKLMMELELGRQALADADPADRQRVQNLVGAKEHEVSEQKGVFKSCVELYTYPFFNPAPKAPVAPVSQDTTLVPVKKVIPWSLVQKKVDEFFNLRTDLPLFKFRLHHHDLPGDPVPASDVTIYKIEAALVNGQVQAVHGQIGYTDLGKLDQDFYFDDVNSGKLNVILSPTAPEPVTLKINFETSGPVEAPTKKLFLSDIDFKDFYVTIKLSFDVKDGKLEFFSWVDKLLELKDDALEAAIEKYIVAHIISTDGIDLGGAMQKRIRAKVYNKLAEATIRPQLSRIISTWVLGGKGDFTINSLVNDGQAITINYMVPKNKLDPFPEATIRPAGWPYKGNAQPDPAFDFSPPANMGNIKHLVILMMENRSFDHMLGYLSLPVSAGGAGRTDVEGLKGDRFNPFNGVNYPAFPWAPGDTRFGPDPSHGYEPVYHQINPEVDDKKQPIPGKGRMDGFVKSYSLEAHTWEKGLQIMGYHTADNVPVYDALVRDFGISDHYFASHPGSTFPNRFYELTGRLNLASGLDLFKVIENTWEVNNSSPLTPVFTKNIFDYLTDYRNTIDNAVTWKYYEHGYSFMRFFSNYTFDDTNIVDVNDPARGFFADAKNGTLPSVSYIDPHYIELPPNANCDGPVADIKAGQDFVRKVVEAVITSPKYANTLLVITYDEHGGFPDHVPPPPALPYLDETNTAPANKFPVQTYGIRVPTFFISPWIKAGSVFGHGDVNGETLYFDHTSILKTIARRFMSKNPPYMGKRYAAAKDFSAVINPTVRKPLFLPFVGYNMTYNASAMRLNVEGGNQTAILTGRFNANTSLEQLFSFEQYGDHIFIRTRFGNRYLTADVPNGSKTAPATGFPIRQNIKYEGAYALTDPVKLNIKYQLWKFTPLDATEAGKKQYIITNAFFPNLVLRPRDLLSNATPIVLGEKIASHPNVWLAGGPVTT